MDIQNKNTRTMNRTYNSPRTKQLRLVLLAATLGAVSAWAATDGRQPWPSESRLQLADVDGDGRVDQLHQGETTQDEHTVRYANLLTLPVQHWRDGYLERRWSAEAMSWVVGDYNGDGRADLLRQARMPDADTELLLTNLDGSIGMPLQTLNDSYLGLRWDAQAHRMLPGDFDGDGVTDLLLQGRTNADRHAIALTRPGYGIDRLSQDFNIELGGFDWSPERHVTVVGDFNGDGLSDVFLQLASRDPGKEDNSNAVFWNDTAHFASPAQTLAADAFGLTWTADQVRLLAGRFNSDAADDLVLLDPKRREATLIYAEQGRFHGVGAKLDKLGDLRAVDNIQVSDIDGDGIAEIVLTYSDGQSPQVLGVSGHENTLRRAFTDNPALSQLGTPRIVMWSLGDAEKGAAATSLLTSEAAVAPEGDMQLAGTAEPQAATSVGVLAGEAGVSGGAAMYDIPIAIPPGRAGMQPRVSLSYSSRAGNGVAGMGWSLNAGVSSIQRCPSAIDPDGYKRAVSFDASDKLCLDGARLLATAGSYGVHGTTYRTELESFVRVTQSGALTGTANSFTVEYKDGSKGYFTQLQIPAGASTPQSWLLARRVDVLGNSVIYEYDTTLGNGELPLRYIRYTGSGATPGSRYVELSYETRPDISESYQSGGLTRQTQRLHAITTFDGSRTVNQYTLGYGASQATDRSLLVWVQWCSLLEASPVCLPATEFNWDQKKPQFVLERLGYTDGSGFHAIHQDKRFLSEAMPHNDTNGDGVIDWPATATESGRYIDAEGKLRGDNTTPSTNCYHSYTSRALICVDVDFNNDGLSDGWRANAQFHMEVAVNNNGTFGSWQDTGIVLPMVYFPERDYPKAFVDLNGDGWKDAVVQHQTEGQSELKVYFHSGGTAPFYSPGNSQSIVTTAIERLQNGSGATFSSMEAAIADDFDGNGYPDFVVTKVAMQVAGVPVGVPSGLPKTLVFTAVNASHQVTFTSRSINDLVPAGEEPYRGSHPTPNAQGAQEALHQNFNFFMDINADGLVDWLALDNGSFGALYWRTNTGGRFGSWQALGASPAGLGHMRTEAYDLPSGSESEGSVEWQAYDKQLRVMDVNGDGKPELLVPGERVVSACAGIPSVGSTGVYGINFYCDDQIYEHYQPSTTSNRTVQIQHPDVDSSVYKYDAVFFNWDNSVGKFVARVEATNLTASVDHTAVADVFGKGLPDLVTAIGCRRGQPTNPGSGSTDSDKCHMGDIVGARKPGDYAINNPAPSRSGDTHLAEGVWVNRNIGSAEAGEDYRPVDMLRKVKDGYQRESSWVLKPLSTGKYSGASCESLSPESFYQTNFAALNPPDVSKQGGYFHFASSMYVVAEFSRSNGIGGLTSSQYRYRGAVYNDWGRGFQGFARIISEQSKSGGAYTRTLSCADFEQVFPTTGTLKTDLTVAANTSQTQPLAKTQVTSATLRPFADNTTYLIVPTSQESQRWDTAGNELKHVTVTSAQAAYDAYGNLTNSETKSQDLLQTNVMTTASVYSPNVSVWWLDKLSRQTVTARQSDTSGKLAETTRLRTTDFSEYHDAYRMAKKVVREAGTALETVTETVLDPIWHTVAETWLKNGSNTATGNRLNADRRVSKIGLNGDGYFPETSLNALGHTAFFTHDAATGQVLDATDPNAVKTETRYDTFGRLKSKEVVGISPKMTLSYEGCAFGCVANAAYKITTTQADAATQVQELDAFDRPVRAHVEGYSGTDILVDTEYDAFGRTTRQSGPYYSGATAYWTRYQDYDVLDRPGSKYSPADTSTFNSNTELKVAYGYSGLTTQITVGQGSDAFTVARTYDSMARVHQTLDAAGNATHFRYNGFGEPELIEDNAGNRTTASYNALGHKINLSDPDKGNWGFTYNIAGELVSQTDAEGRMTTLAYDSLGRARSRSEKGVSSPMSTVVAIWDYDTALRGASGQAALGQLANAEKLGEAKTSYTYDSYARPEGTTLTAGARSWTLNQGYDGNSRPKSLTYPGSTSREAAIQSYQRGYLANIKNGTGAYTYQSVLERDARAQLTKFSFGNGLTAQYTRSAATGALLDICLNAGTGCTVNNLANKQALEYRHDQFGNLRQQDNLVQRVQEEFTYDALQRLKSSTRRASVLGASGYSDFNALAYDYDKQGLGNLIKKGDFGDNLVYGSEAGINPATYAAYKPHQVGVVKSAAGTELARYRYDRNGNLTSGGVTGAVRSIAYNHQSKPTRITRGDRATTFYYDAGGQRYRQVETKAGAVVKETWYVGGVYEEVIAGTVTERKHYMGDSVVLTKKTDCNELRFLHQDRLGSVDTVTDANGVVVERRGFDAFGKPRAGVWLMDSTADGLAPSLTNPVGLFSKVTTKGFTGHEHVDSVGLIHMNGRAYDPELGRFLSVDPFIQAPTNSQSLNPYSYVMNNPLAMTDPTGYAGTCGEKETCESHMEAPTGSRIKSNTVGSRTNTETGDRTTTVSGKSGMVMASYSLSNGVGGKPAASSAGKAVKSNADIGSPGDRQTEFAASGGRVLGSALNSPAGDTSAPLPGTVDPGIVDAARKDGKQLQEEGGSSYVEACQNICLDKATNQYFGGPIKKSDSPVACPVNTLTCGGVGERVAISHIHQGEKGRVRVKESDLKYLRDSKIHDLAAMQLERRSYVNIPYDPDNLSVQDMDTARKLKIPVLLIRSDGGVQSTDGKTRTDYP